MRIHLAMIILLLGTQASAMESWFDYPSFIQLKSMSPAITRFEVKADIVLPPVTTALELVKDESRGDDGASETLCTLSYAASSDYRRLVASTALAVTSIEATGDANASDERRRAKVVVGLETEGGFRAQLECSHFYDYWIDNDYWIGSRSDQTPSTLSRWFRVQRKETVISPF